MVIATTVVGVALLRLALRTRQSPEALMGAALLLIGPIGQPLTYASGTGRLVAGEVDLLLNVLSAAAVTVGLGCLFFFTARVFYRDSLGAHLASGLGSLVVAVSYAGAVVKTATALPTLHSETVMAGWALGIQAPLLICFGWPAWAAWSQHLRMRKRLDLGLADPVVTNRFLLFATAMGAAFLMMIVTIGLGLMGVSGAHIANRLIISIGSAVNATSMYLAFVPPARYTRWVANAGATR
jgi:hypothetical protein